MYRGRVFNRESVWRSGNMIDGAVYPVFQPAGKRRKKCKPTREVQEKLNQRNRERKFRRQLEANFSRGDYIAHLTAAPGIGEERFLRDVSNWLAKCSRRYAAAGREWKWMKRIEYGRQGKLHAHVILSGGIDRDTLEGLWTDGFINIDRLQPERDFGLAKLAKYLTKDSQTRADGSRIYRGWSHSRNVATPEPEQHDGRISARELDELAGACENGTAYLSLERKYPGFVLVRAEAVRNEINRSWYVTFEMRRKEEGRAGLQAFAQRQQDL